MSEKKTLAVSIRYSKLWVSQVAADGGMGKDFTEVSQGAREGTLQFNGSSADTTTYKNVLGETLERSFMKGDVTLNFQGANMNPEVIQIFTGGDVTTTADYVKFQVAENENDPVELSVAFLTTDGFYFEVPRVQFDTFPVINDDDLHYFTMEGGLLKPEKTGVRGYDYYQLTTAGKAKNDITAISFDELDGTPVIDAGAKTVVATAATGTALTALSVTVEVSPGASATDPASGSEQDFTTGVVYAIQAADGTSENWTITITAP